MACSKVTFTFTFKLKGTFGTRQAIRPLKMWQSSDFGNGEKQIEITRRLDRDIAC